MENIKFVFFDIGYTLVNEDEVWKHRCQEQTKTDEAKALNLTPERIYDEIVQASIAYQPQYRTVVRKFNFTQQAPYCHVFEKLYEDTNLVLRSLSQKYKLGIIANQTDGLVNRLNAWGIANYFTSIISSWDYHVMKPDAQLFQLAVEKSGCKANETVMVGDRLDNDVFPAKSIGMKTIWIKQGFGGMQQPQSSAYVPDAKVNTLSELLRIL